MTPARTKETAYVTTDQPPNENWAGHWASYPAVFGLHPRTCAALIGAAILATTGLHFLTHRDLLVLHEFYQRLYYVPIILAALLFGWRGGLAAALCASLTFAPHIWLHWQTSHYHYAINQYAEIVLFHLVGGLVGWLGERRRRAQARAEKTACELQTAYTELRQTFEQLLLADRLTSLGELASSVVHEVRNPLAAIKGAVEILADEIAPHSPRREFAALAQHEIERLNGIIEDFLRFARPAPLNKQDLNLNELVRTVAALLEQRAHAQQVTVHFELDNSLPLVAADASQITQVLLNLALNALQAMPDGGQLTFCSRTEAAYVVLEVADTGPGLAPHTAARIFDPFFTTKDQGTGLGLSIAYKIMQQHGGTLSGANATQGATFRLTLPRAHLHGNLQL